MIPVAKPRMNFNDVLKPLVRAVTTTKSISGPGVNANTIDAKTNEEISENDNFF